MAFQRDAAPTGSRTEYRKFVQADIEDNHNKYWNVGLYDSGDVEIEFGRIGVTKTQGIHTGVGRSYMDKKIKSKLKGKLKDGKREYYREIQTIDSSGTSVTSVKSLKKNTLKTIAKNQIKHSSPETAKLIEWLAEVNRHSITNATGGKVTFDTDSGLFKTPMGVIMPDAITEARNLLVDIGDYVDRKKFGSKVLKRKINDYLTLVPTNVGMKLSIEKFVPDITAVQNQGKILDALDASYIDVVKSDKKPKNDKAKEKEEKVFETKLIVLDDSKERDRIENYFRKSANRNHYNAYNMKIKNIWVVDIAPMQRAFDKDGSKVGNVMELLHGTLASNCLSILKVGLVVPPTSSSHVTGRMFHNGLYFSDQSTKALNYATSFWGGRDVGRYFMFLSNVAMGKYYVPSGPRNVPPPQGYDSYFAQGRKSGVQNNEMIVPRTSQASLKFLVEFSR